MPDGRFGLEMAVAAKNFANVWMFEQQLANLRAAQIRFGEIPLGAVRRRE
jgi:hypothetical protein